MKFNIASFFLIFLFDSSIASVAPNSIFSDHMILQKGAMVPIWGTAAEGEQVTVKFQGQTVTTTTINGKWLVRLAPMPYVCSSSAMIIQGKNTVVINDILVGEVWLCSGQSNMERQ